MPNWIRNAGKILCAGDSITAGYLGLTGGWRKKLFQQLEDEGVRFTAVGPYTTDSPDMTATAHRGLSGDKAQDAAAGIGATVATYDPTVIIWGFGMNDLGNGRTSSQYLTDLDSCIDAAQANGFCLHLVQTLILPTSGNPSYFANLAQYTAAQAALPARIATQGGTMIDVGTPTLTDGVHPADGATGFDAMADDILAAVLAAIP